MAGRTRTINDPLYGDIRLDEHACKVIDTQAFQRLRRIKQLGFVHLVFPSATHTRFEHPLGAYHLSGAVLDRMAERGELDGVSEDDIRLTRLAALVHDLGHWPLAHIIEEHGFAGADHEQDGEAWIARGEIGDILSATGIPDAGPRIAQMIRHEGTHPLRTLVAGEVDVDRLDYLARDPYYCGIPRSMNQKRIVKYLVLRDDPVSGRPTVMVDEKGLINLDQMVWQKFDLFRSVFWHRVVRAASAMGRSLLIQSIESGLVTMDEVRGWSDEELIFVLRSRLEAGERPDEDVARMLGRIERRDIYSVATTLPMGGLPPLGATTRRRVEDRLEDELGLRRGEALLDVPHKPGMYDLDIQIARRDGTAVPLMEMGPDDGFVSGFSRSQMYRASGRIRVFTAEPRTLATERLERIVQDVAGGAWGLA